MIRRCVGTLLKNSVAMASSRIHKKSRFSPRQSVKKSTSESKINQVETEMNEIIVTKQVSVTHQNEKDAIDKLSHVQLSAEQTSLKKTILEFTRDSLSNYKPGDSASVFVIDGDAGTGKSVILNALFNEIQKISRASGAGDSRDVLKNTENYLVVNHPEMLKLYHRLSASFDYLTKKDIERPTSLINRMAKEKVKGCDVIIVDEAHLLATAKNAYKRFYGDNHLEELMKLGKVLIIVYDDKQSLRMDQYWSEGTDNGGTFSDHLAQAKVQQTYYLKQQFRVTGSPDVQEWIKSISTTKKILDLPTSDAVRRSSGDKNAFDFKIWDDCGAMYSEIKKMNHTYGQCRMLCTYDFPYRLGTTDWFVTCGDNFKLRWDRFAPSNIKPWSERPDTIDEVGSVYTVQGFDLNYAGVIFGRSIGYDKRKDEIVIKPELYDDKAGFTKRGNIAEVDTVKEKIILNSINVLLTRGVRGLYIYSWDEELRERLKNGA